MSRYTAGYRHAAFDFGVQKLAYELDEMNQMTLYKKLDDEQESHHLTRNDCDRIIRITKDVRCIQANLDDLGMIAVKRVTVEAGDESIFRLALEHEARSGALMDELLTAVDDDQIDDEELSRLEERFLENARKAAELRAAVKAKHAADKKLKAVQ